MVFSGGHSGKDIGEKRGNPIIILGKILSILDSQTTLYLNSIDAGTWVTSIPRKAKGIVTYNSIDLDFLKKILKKLQSTLQKQYHNDDISIHVEKLQNQTLAFDEETTKQIINYLVTFPNGELIRDKEKEYPVLSTNLGTAWIENHSFLSENSIRSNMDEKTTKMLIDRIKGIEKSNCLTTIDTYDFTGYRQNDDSEFINYLVKKYKEVFKKEPHIKEEHFLLECAWFSKKVPNLEYVSISPNIYDPHSPFEKVSISSIKRVWSYIKSVVKDLDKKLEKENENEER